MERRVEEKERKGRDGVKEHKEKVEEEDKEEGG